MYRQAWHVGLKTTYYLRSLGASNIEKATVGVKKEMRGAVNEGSSGGQNSGDAGGSHGATASTPRFDTMPATSSVVKKEYTAAEKTACSIEAMRNGGECEACQ